MSDDIYDPHAHYFSLQVCSTVSYGGILLIYPSWALLFPQPTAQLHSNYKYTMIDYDMAAGGKFDSFPVYESIIQYLSLYELLYCIPETTVLYPPPPPGSEFIIIKNLGA